MSVDMLLLDAKKQPGRLYGDIRNSPNQSRWSTSDLSAMRMFLPHILLGK
ncbi:unnamed protein product [Brassica oleracea var. botrytis]|uniref:BnaC01g38810D protein n=1 Tax=Brassica napus TaxID=3708 RepID=A0A078G6Y5_BRANA|nr:BnaC01g38810D [Brassica napus]